MTRALDQINEFLADKENKKYHYNDYAEVDYKISSGSLNLDIAMGGGFCAGAHRLTGVNEGGKTSCALTVAKNFQDHFGTDGMVVIIKSEGRLRKEMLNKLELNQDPETICSADSQPLGICGDLSARINFVRRTRYQYPVSIALARG